MRETSNTFRFRLLLACMYLGTVDDFRLLAVEHLANLTGDQSLSCAWGSVQQHTLRMQWPIQGEEATCELVAAYLDVRHSHPAHNRSWEDARGESTPEDVLELPIEAP